MAFFSAPFLASAQTSSITDEIKKIEEEAIKNGMSVLGVGKGVDDGLRPEFGLPAVGVPEFNAIQRAVQITEGSSLRTTSEAKTLLNILATSQIFIREALFQVKKTLEQNDKNSYKIEWKKAQDLIASFCTKKSASSQVSSQGNCLLNSFEKASKVSLASIEGVMTYEGTLVDEEVILTFRVLLDLSQSLSRSLLGLKSNLRRLYFTKVEAALRAIDRDSTLSQAKKNYQKENLTRLVFELERARIEEEIAQAKKQKADALALKKTNLKLYQGLKERANRELQTECQAKRNRVYQLFWGAKKRCEKKVMRRYGKLLKALDPR